VAELIDYLSRDVKHIQSLFSNADPRQWTITDTELSDADVAESQPPDPVVPWVTQAALHAAFPNEEADVAAFLNAKRKKAL
jgi:hypothetical protein